MPVFLDELIRPFYQAIGSTFRAALTRGQICFAPISYTRENLQLWRPRDYDDSRTSATDFRIVAAPADKFARSTPLADPQLATNEEFAVSRVKMRPVIVLGPAPPDPGIQGLRGGGRIYRRLTTVIPVYSLVNRHNRTLKYPPGFVEGLRRLEFEEFLYLPEEAGVLRLASYARVAETQSVYEPHLDHCDLRLSDEALRILQDQVLFHATGRYDGVLEAYREELMNQDPKK